ncbi:hypothetical protein N6H05_09525 [Sphingobium sp. WTD-1]|uniref:hypothetical protein n=1 Tax=Sphingobium sp. WTD-1 TaxID=2979467 RepID=UPI0024DE11BF|nr:hypothetical protein [Sphingobium sp. WTD-1]WIA58010.1 hypothetical protein N6H05_09525 [Sphingobium sp. WTD-1]
MLTDIIGAVIGSKIDQKDGDSGVKGAVLGYFAPRVVGTFIKVSVLAAVGYGVVKAAQSFAADDGEKWF